jgi:hypothetical protein
LYFTILDKSAATNLYFTILDKSAAANLYFTILDKSAAARVLWYGFRVTFGCVSGALVWVSGDLRVPFWCSSVGFG